MNRFCFLLWCVVWSTMPLTVGRAGLIVDIQSATLTSGGKGYVDVLVSSLDPVEVQLANYTFLITPAPGNTAPGVLEFDTNQTNVDKTLPNYVFANLTDTSIVTKTVVSPERLTGFDFTTTGANVQIDNSRTWLLSRLQLMHTGAGLQGDFHISLVKGDLFTYFETDVPVKVPIEESSFNKVGTINVISAVPEPSTCLLSAGLIAAIVARRRKKCKTAVLCR